MTIDWIHFTPWASLFGGALLGLSAVVLILCNGRVAGISGIIGGLFSPSPGDLAWRIAFIAGIMLPGFFYVLLWGIPAIALESSSTLLIAAGLLVGVGTRLGSGCTSGHGVCGLSRFSIRSLVATLCFMGSGVITVFILRHIIV